MSGMSEFSVIIPTLQRAKELHELVEMCAAHPRVLEVLVINNAPEPLSWESPKVRVLQQEQNIYVNPAWNLGAREARGKYLAIINDDVLFEPGLFDYLSRLLRRRWVGIVGPDGAYLNRDGQALRWRPAAHAHVTSGFGMLMALRREEYTPIPDDLLIWGGDDWLFLNSRRLPVVFHGGGLRSEVSVTSGSPQFQAMWVAEARRVDAHIGRVQGTRWWHGPTDALTSVRKARARLRALRPGIAA